MKKIVLKKAGISDNKSKTGYKINYEIELNKPQYDAVMHNSGAALVIAGAGTGKTRTLVFRVARLIEDGIQPESILLLTFTRKSASEMLRRASILLDGRCDRVSGGTFHSFASQILRRHAERIGYQNTFNILDQSDSEDVINLVRNKHINDKSKKRFPIKSTLLKIYSLSKNTVSSFEEMIENQFPWFIEQTDRIIRILEEYQGYKKIYNLMDYDDLLLNILKLMKESPAALLEINATYQYTMVDEYQDSNRLQHEIVMCLAGKNQNVMAVGDDAQSIYSFRGANFQNIMFFPESFADCKIFKIEENYRSTQPILDMTNVMINDALFKYEKNLFTKRLEGEIPKLISTSTERQQSQFITQQILEHREEGIPLDNIAVLFRSGFHSFDLEIELEKANIPFQKFGGMKFIETSHIKDLIAYTRILFNPKDAISWQRVLLLMEGIGPAKAAQVIEGITDNSLSLDNYEKLNLGKHNEPIKNLFKILKDLKKSKVSIGDKTALLAEYYRPILQSKYDDWQKRWKDIETFMTIAERYDSISSFLNDMAIDPPIESVSELTPESKDDEMLTLSTIHSAKGLEWKVVFLIWALEGRFPSAKASDNLDTIEEERRLFYVACTRAKDYLYITYPTNIFDRESGFVLSQPSRFIADIDESLLDRYIIAEE